MARKNYSKEFRRQAVDLYEFTPGPRSAASLKDLGIVRGTLRHWLETYSTCKKTAARGQAGHRPVQRRDLDAVNLDSAMVTHAQLGSAAGQVLLEQGNAHEAAGSAWCRGHQLRRMFYFRIVHHITNWRDAVAEVSRYYDRAAGSSSTRSPPHPLARR